MVSFNETACLCMLMYEENHDRQESSKPNQFLRRDSKIEWSTVSNAADRSRRMGAVTSPLSMEDVMSLWIFRRVDSVELNEQYADWKGRKRELVHSTDDYFFKNFGYEIKIWDRAIVIRIFRMEWGLFQQGAHLSIFFLNWGEKTSANE